jgi:hypothetical protein
VLLPRSPLVEYNIPQLGESATFAVDGLECVVLVLGFARLALACGASGNAIEGVVWLAGGGIVGTWCLDFGSF